MEKYVRIIILVIYSIALFPKFHISIFAFLCYAFCEIFKAKRFCCSYFNIFSILLILVFKLLNYFYIHSNTIAQILFIFGVTAILFLYVDKTSKIKTLWLSFLFCFLLPVEEYVRIFIGTPLRFFSAQVISNLLNFFGIENIIQSSVIFVENKISNIDYSCSGSATIMVLFLFISILGFILRVKFSFKNLFVIVCSILSFIFLNTLRIFIIILLNYFNINHTLISALHSGLGFLNFAIIFSFLFYFLSKAQVSLEDEKAIHNKNLEKIILFLGIIFLFFRFLPVLKYDTIESQIVLKDNLKLTKQEEEFFKRHSAIVEKLLIGDTIKLSVSTNNWVAHHNPKNCIIAGNTKIIADDTIVLDKAFIRKVKTNKGYIYYFFTDGNVVLDDYYKRAFLSIFSKNKRWLFVEYSSLTPLEDEFLIDEIGNIIKTVF